MEIRPIDALDLDPSSLRTRIYPDEAQTYYWSDCWDPEFYVALAEAGFISISMAHPRAGDVLIPELQDRYAVLDWADVHVSRNLRKLLRSGRIESEGIELRVVDDPRRVVARLLDQYREETWLTERYVDLIERLPTEDVRGFALHGVELWARERNRLVAGELGYSIGRTYTSLSGFHTPDDVDAGHWRHFGTLQMWLLAQRLEERGYAFWNLGHPRPRYKTEFGARLVPRAEFLARWGVAQADRSGESIRS